MVVRQTIVRLLGAVTLVAFASLWVQLHALIGSEGILPVDRFLLQRADRSLLGTPTLLWWWHDDLALTVACAAGVGLSGWLALGARLQGPILLALWALYLSLSVAGQAFLSFQWDTLLTETLFCTMFVARWQIRIDRPPSPLGIWVLRLLLFKLMFTSGVVKLTSGDPTWWDGRAMAVHYWTQPLPNPLSPLVHGLPLWFHRLETWATLLIEIVLPFGIFLGRPGRRAALIGFTLVLALLFLTGNYGFFQWLTMVLVLALLDERDLRPVARPTPDPSPLSHWLAAAWLLISIPIGAAHSWGRAYDYRQLPDPAFEAIKLVYPWRTVNAYGLFATMTTHRDEVWIEGSDDGTEWQRYVLPYQPGPVDRPPPVAGLHMPRLDWQMWFAALGPCERSPWLSRLLDELQEGNPMVQSRFEHVPFPDGPQWIRTRRVPYRFGTEHWWEHGSARSHCPVRRR